MDNINIKKNTLYVVIGVLVFGGFLTFAFINMASSNNINEELVQGGKPGLNKVVNDGDVQIVNLGVANYNYDPQTITVSSGKPVKIIGNMQQLQGCLRAFTIPNLGISKVFSQGNNVLEFIPKEKGTFPFSCSMGMGYGKLIIT